MLLLQYTYIYLINLHNRTTDSILHRTALSLNFLLKEEFVLIESANYFYLEEINIVIVFWMFDQEDLVCFFSYMYIRYLNTSVNY